MRMMEALHTCYCVSFSLGRAEKEGKERKRIGAFCAHTLLHAHSTGLLPTSYTIFACLLFGTFGLGRAGRHAFACLTAFSA